MIISKNESRKRIWEKVKIVEENDDYCIVNNYNYQLISHQSFYTYDQQQQYYHHQQLYH